MPSPATFDDRWPRLTRLATATGRTSRWPQIEHLLGQPENEVVDTVHIAAAGLSRRLLHITESAPTEDKLWLISGLLYQQLLAPDGYTREHFYRLLWLVIRGDLDLITPEDVFVLLDAVWAVKLTWDSEAPRREIVSAWLTETSRAPVDSSDGLADQILPELNQALPAGWTRAQGSLTVVAGQTLATLTVSTSPDEPGIFHHIVALPSLVELRRRSRHWWRCTITATPESAQITIPDQTTPPDPSELLRLSDFRAESDLYGLTDTPEWVSSYTLRRTIAYTPDGERPVVGTAEALDAIRCEAAVLGMPEHTFRTDQLVAVRLPAGYRVFMYHAPDTPFGELIIDSPVFYLGDDGRIYRPKSGNPLSANEEFRESFARNNGYDSTTGATWPTTIAPVLGPPRQPR